MGNVFLLKKLHLWFSNLSESLHLGRLNVLGENSRQLLQKLDIEKAWTQTDQTSTCQWQLASKELVVGRTDK